jgi:hypothetical protein
MQLYLPYPKCKQDGTDAVGHFGPGAIKDSDFVGCTAGAIDYFYLQVLPTVHSCKEVEGGGDFLNSSFFIYMVAACLAFDCL